MGQIKANRSKGQELVEFAVVLPLLLLVLAGVLDLGRAFHASITISNAARVGARFGINYNWTKPGGYDAIISAAKQEASNSYIDPTQMQVIPNCGACTTGQLLTVTVRYPFQFIIGPILPWAQITLERSAVMMIP